jgi:UDP-glucose 4-epimerase
MRVLITGAANWHGAALARRLAAADDTELVVALDTRRPPDDVLDLRDLVHVEADVRSPDLARLLAPHRIDAVIHNEVLQFAEPGRSARLLHDVNVVGTLQLLTACDALPGVRRIVARSSAAIYGTEPDAPGFFTEGMARRFPLRTRWQRDVGELERLIEAYARRHPEVACTMLRFQPVFAPGLDTPITRLLRAPVVPTWLGYDPRIQVVGGEDAVGAVEAALRAGVRGAVNVAADGTMALSRVLRRLGRRTLPLAPGLFGAATGLAARAGLPAISEDTARYLRYGRGVDTTRLRTEVGFTPALTTLQAIEATAEAPR